MFVVARALNVLPLEQAILILLFYMRNMLIMADDADDEHDANASVIFDHLAGIVAAAARDILVIALQVLIWPEKNYRVFLIFFFLTRHLLRFINHNENWLVLLHRLMAPLY